MLLATSRELRQPRRFVSSDLALPRALATMSWPSPRLQEHAADLVVISVQRCTFRNRIRNKTRSWDDSERCVVPPSARNAY
eukprot:gene15583-biopygen9725